MMTDTRPLWDELYERTGGDWDLMFEIIMNSPREYEWALRMELYKPRSCDCRFAR